MGSWKSIEEMEECISLGELNALVEGARDKEEREQRFLAALKGIDLGDSKAPEDGVPTFEEIQQRAAAHVQGKTEKELEYDSQKVEFADIGIDFE